ncbi:hypothetical protein ACG3SL_02200 [Sphingomonas sp. CJ20]
MAAPTKTRSTRGSAAKAKPASKSGGTSVLAGTLSIGAVLGVLAAGIFGLRRARRAPSGGEHVPTDLLGDTRPDPQDRAIDAFRPDPTAPVPASERDALRPALLDERPVN